MESKLLALIGKSLTHSFSPAYFKNKFLQESITDYHYIPLEIPDISDIAKILKVYPNLVGFNVTIPYKEEIIPFLHEIDHLAEQIGAVNVVKVFQENGVRKLKGYNTDYIGFSNTLDFILGCKDKHLLKVVVLGSGGASKAIQQVLYDQQINFLVVSRTEKIGSITYRELNEGLIPRINLIVNCTPLGTFPAVDQLPPIDFTQISQKHTLVDLIYNPPVTRFLEEGKRRGATICNGQKMLETQAEESWKIFIS